MYRTPLLPLLLMLSGTASFAENYLPSVEAVSRVADVLSLNELDIHPDEKGADATGTLPGGTRVELDLHHNGELDKIEAIGHQTMPLVDLMPILPAELSAPSLTPQSHIIKVEFSDDELEIEGRNGDGREFKGEFTRSGRLLEWKQD